MSSPLKNPFVVEFGGQQENGTSPASEGITKGSHSEVNYIPAIDEDDEGPRAIYSKLETSSTIVTFVSDGDGSGSGSHRPQGEKNHRQSLDYPVDESVLETLLVFLTSSFNLWFSLGIAYWHFSEGLETQAYATVVIVVISAVIIQLVYAFHRNLSKAKIWDTSKVFAILTIIPGTLPSLLSFADLIFAIREAENRSYVRPWKNTHLIYLAESLVLALPQCVLQSVFLLEDSESIPKIKGLFVLFSLGLMTMGIALARIFHDSARRPGRFGAGLDKIVRASVIWGNKGLWVTTYALVVVTARLIHPDNTMCTVTAVLCLFVTYEVPVILSSLNSLRSCVSRISGMFFLIPQFVSLFVLILWVNADPTVYLTNVGVCALGAFSWFESLSIIGWLLDGCNDREMDILPLYPHFLGDFYSSACCCKGKQTNEFK